MGKIDAITKAIEDLTVEERAELRAWLDELDERLFDEAIERDAKAGRLDELAARALEAHRRGLTRPL